MQLPHGVVARIATAQAYRQAVTPDRIAEAFPDLKPGAFFRIPADRDERARPLWEPIDGVYHREHVLLERDEELVGWFQGEQSAGLTFYMRNSAILPAFQRQGLYSAMLDGVLSYLRNLGYEQVTSEHLPDNNAVLIPKLRAGFLFDGVVVNERFGWLLRLRKSLHADREEATRRHYRPR
jgi:ribosomal protein S18 acetylase RimI-like enzyme